MQMKLITANTVYAYTKDMYSGTHAVLVLEAKLWVEEEVWGPKSGRTYTLHTAQPGARAGRKTGIHNSTTGIPVLKLSSTDYRFLDSTDPEDRIAEPVRDILLRARELFNAYDFLDKDLNTRAARDSGLPYMTRRVQVPVQRADGKTVSVCVDLEFVRPQTVITEWSQHLLNKRAEELQKAENEQKRAEKRAKSDAIAQDITSRVTTLLDDADEAPYTGTGERWDVRRTISSGTTYEVSEEILLKLLALAEKSTEN